jgi:hypothetical protein
LWYLNPVGGDLGDGEHDGTGVGWGDDPCGIVGLVCWTGPGDKFPVEKFVEVSVSVVQILDQQLFRLNRILFDKVGLQHILTMNTHPDGEKGRMRGRRGREYDFRD